MQKIGNCMPSKEIIASLCSEKLKKLTMKTQMKERFLMTNFFWKTVKPSLSEKLNTRERISVSENGEIVKTEKETADVFNNFFDNTVKNLNNSQYSDFDPVIENVKDATLKVILKYKKHPTINVRGMVFLVLGRSVFRKLKQKLDF